MKNSLLKLACIFLLFAPVSLGAQTFGLLKDINSITTASSSAMQNSLEINGTIYFRATNGIDGNELWKTDGTTAGTVMVKDITPGAGSGFPGSLANMNGILYFQAFDGVNGGELWKSDGTAAGTVMVKDIYPGTNSSNPAYITVVNNLLYFQATDGVNGYELWKSDGTAGGTVLVKDISSGTAGSFLLQ